MDESSLLGTVFSVGALVLVLLGLMAVAAARNLIRVLLGLSLLEGGVHLFLVALGYRPNAVAPIWTPGSNAASMVDPIPQALILTAIVIGVSVLALGLALAIRVHEAWGTLDTRVLAERLAGRESEADVGSHSTAVLARPASRLRSAPPHE